MPTQNATAFRPFEPADQPALLHVCTAARFALRDTVDLLLLHNEKPVSGKQPRSTLNPLVVLLAVATWERLITDVTYVQTYGSYPGPGTEPSLSGASYLTRGRQTSLPLLTAATDGALPDAWRIKVPYGAAGKRLHSFVEHDGYEPELHTLIDGHTRMRNGVAHLVTPQIAQSHPEDWLFTDAKFGDTVNTSTARMVAATMLQLVDQTVLHLLRTAQVAPARIDATRPPAHWFTDDRDGDDGSRSYQPGCLWGGAVLKRPDSHSGTSIPGQHSQTDK